MPGIYVRETSWIDWMQQRKSPVLTVPGSYWLCHKHNIYKFIFRYRPTTREGKHFTFGKELLKIIRRIIKYPPREGQQFSTNNLLVTYNYTSWTRHDKIFAMTKFKERSATAFSHAFVLTIKVISLSESSEQNTKCSETSCSDGSSVWNDEEMERDEVNAFNDLSEESKQYDNKQEKVNELKNKNVQLDDNLAVNNLTKKTMNKKLIKQIICGKDVNTIQSHLTSNELTENVKINNTQNSNKHLEHTNRKLKEDNNCTVSDKYSSVFITEANGLISNELENLNCSQKNIIEDKDHNNKLLVIDRSIMKNSTSKFTNSVIDSKNVDSTNLPYQYLIEKEIEDAKLNTFNSEVSLYNSRKRKKEEVIKEYSAPLESDTSILDIEASDSITERKRRTYNMSPRSSDITDLVMEGLMFTIRQGQDTVAVIEQKTKLDIDEVLENSEKIETKKGEKCLRNSSLIGLENLITMIELPKKTEMEQKCQNINIQENISKCQSTMFNNGDINKDSNVTNKNENIEIHEEDMKLTKTKDLEYEGEERKEEEDIVSEASQEHFFQSFDKINKSQEAIINKDLLMDETDTETSIKHGVTTKLDPSFNEKHTVQHKAIINNPKQCKSNLPIIISNEIIPTDRIPLPLQKILRNKLPIKHSPLNDINKTEKNNTVDYKMQLSTCRSPNCNSLNVEKQRLNCNTLELIPVSLEGDQEKSNIREKRLKMEENKLQKQSVSTNKEEQSSLCEMQDVTQQFYQDILYLQKKKNLVSKQHFNLRSKKKFENMNQKPNTHETRIEMLKLFHDITKGAKVVVRRMSTKRVHSLIAKTSSLPTTMH